MKQLRILPLLLALALSLTACGGTPNKPAEPELSGASASEGEDTMQKPQEPIVVADAARYRGTVAAIEEQEEGLLLTLETYPGTKGEGGQFLLPTDAPRSFEDGQLAEGCYLEVYYSARPGGEAPTEILAANLYGEAERYLLDGTIVELYADEQQPEKGRILLARENGQQVAVNYDAGTQFYLDFDELREGDHLIVLHTGKMARSLPPQVFAVEVSHYVQPELTRS